MHPPTHNTARPTPVGRFAPSPTGDLHLGNLRTALLAHDDIRRRGGRFILRMEDTDTPRNVPGAEARIIEDLLWLGITFDEGPHLPSNSGPHGPYRQSQRHSHYLQHLATLLAAGLIYPCTCSRKNLQSAASAPHGPDGPRYPGICRRDISPDETTTLLSQVQAATVAPRPLPFSLRLRTDLLPACRFTEESRGPLTVNIERECGDFVLFRRDGLWAYQFVCAVDDALMGINRVVRGADLVTSTPRQVALIQALGFTPPIYHHIPLVADALGQRMSKRDGSLGLAPLRQTGLSAAQARAFITDLPELTQP